MLFGGEPPLEDGERRVIIMHAHVWPLVRAALPLPLLLLLPIPYAALDVVAPDLRLAALSPLFLLLLVAAGACYLLKWLLFDLLPWSQQVYVLTDRRIIAQSGVLAVHRRESSLLKIQESDYVSRGPVARLLDVGDVEVQTAGGLGTIVLGAVARPRHVLSLINTQARALREDVTRRRLAEAPDEVVRQLTAAVQGVPSAHAAPTEPVRAVSQRAVRAQRRLNLLQDEAVIEVMRQHRVVLAVGLLAPVFAALFVAVATAVLGLALLPAALALVVCVLAPWAIWRVLAYLAHEYVLTTDRLMELRNTPFVFQMRDIVQLSSVQDVILEIPTLFGRLADIGDVVVEVEGPGEQVVLKSVGRPAQFQKLIFETIDARRRRQQDKEDQRLVTTLSRWFEEYHKLQQGGGAP